MADYRLTQTGDQVQSLLNQVTPNAQAIEGLQNNKVDKEEGKVLSDENFTSTEKNKLDNLPTESELNTELDKKATIVSLGEETQARQQADNTLQGNIDTINGKIPAAASPQNKLVDEQKMNSSIATATATYRGSYNLVNDLHLTVAATEADIVNALAITIVTADNNDYCYVQVPVANDKPTEIARVDRYKFNGTIWALEYTLNNSGFTAAQWDAINSGITSGLVAKLNALPNNAELIALLAAKAPQATTYTKSEVDALIANFITASVNNLVNYYLKSDTYTKAEVQQLIDAVKQFTYVSVAELPTASADTMNKIYLVPSTNPKTQNVKDEFITIAVTDQGTTTYSWEQIGSTTIDLSGYYTSAQTDAAIANALSAYSTTQEMNAAITSALNTALADYSTTIQMNAAIATAIAAYYTKTEVDALIANFITASVNNLVNYYLKSDTYTKAEVQQLIDAVKQFTYVSVAELPTASADTMNKIYLVPSTNPKTQNVKDEFITIAVTDQGTTTYSWEQIGSTTIDLSGYYTSAQTDAAIANALSAYSTTQEMNAAITSALNTALADYSTTIQMNAAIATAIAAYYTKTEVDALIANFITTSTQSLVYYYLKSETYSASEVDQLLAAIKQFTYESVSTLPTASAQTMNKIYLVPSADPKTSNVKDEYITLSVTDQGQTTYYWECIGSTSLDLSNYYTKTQTDAAITAALNTALASYYTKTEADNAISTAISTAIANYYTKTQVDGLIANFITKSVNDLVNYYLKSETYTKAEVQALIDNIKQFQYEAVQTLPEASAQTVGKIYLVPNGSSQAQNVKDEYITLTTTEEGTTTYSWECIGSTTIDLSNYYTKSQTYAAITASINLALADYSTTQQMSTVISTAITTALASYYNKSEIDQMMAQKQATLTFDNEPTAGSNNPVKSGGIKMAIDSVENEVSALHDRIDALFNTDYVGFSVRLNDTSKVMNIIGTAEQLAAFDEWVDQSPRPCEVKKDGTDFAYLTNTAGVASNVNWQTRADGTPSKYSTADKDYLQMVELENVNLSIETTGTQLRVLFNFAEIAPEGFHRMFAEPTKLMSRYDLTFNSDGNTLDCTKGTSQPSGTFSFDNLHSMLDATGTDLLNWTAWEIACLAWIQAMRFRTLNVPGSARGRGLQDGSETSARGWVNGTTDTLISPHGGVDQAGNGGYRFQYMENCIDGKQWLCGFGWRGDNGIAHFTRDDYKANIAATISVEDCEATHDYPTNLSATYAKNVSELGIATEGGGSDSSGFFDGNWSNTSTARIFYAGGNSDNGSLDGPFARAVGDDASDAYWRQRGRCAMRKSEVVSA